MKQIQERFDRETIDSRFDWFCPPKDWEIDLTNHRLLVRPDAESDFWQKTHYGFSADNGHFLRCMWEGDFELETRVLLRFRNQYDQAGLMVRYSSDEWMKVSIEYELDEPNKLGSVVTRGGYSDWAVQNLNDEVTAVSFKVARSGQNLLSFFRFDDSKQWEMMRIAHLEIPSRIECGIYACSPKGPGFQAEFEYVSLGP